MNYYKLGLITLLSYFLCTIGGISLAEELSGDITSHPPPLPAHLDEEVERLKELVESCKFNNLTGIAIEETLIVDGLVRKAIVHLPAGYQQKDSLPMVMVFHGARLSGRIAEEVTGFNKLSNTENFIVVYPDAVHRQWNDGRNEGDTPSYGVDDAKFVSKFMDYMIYKYNINAKRVYFTGYSSGGMLIQKLAMEMAERIAAIAPVASSIPEPQLALQKTPSMPVPVLMINGTKDQAFPWEGGDTTILGVKVGRVSSVIDSLNYWLKANGGTDVPPDFHSCQNKKKDGTSVDVSYFPTKNHACVLLYKVNGGGHTWPGSSVPLRYIPFLGRQSNDLSASELIWEFFKHYSRD